MLEKLNRDVIEYYGSTTTIIILLEVQPAQEGLKDHVSENPLVKLFQNTVMWSASEMLFIGFFFSSFLFKKNHWSLSLWTSAYTTLNVSKVHTLVT